MPNIFPAKGESSLSKKYTYTFQHEKNPGWNKTTFIAQNGPVPTFGNGASVLPAPPVYPIYARGYISSLPAGLWVSLPVCGNISYKMGIIYYIVVIFFNYVYLIDIVFVNIIQS